MRSARFRLLATLLIISSVFLSQRHYRWVVPAEASTGEHSARHKFLEVQQAAGSGRQDGQLSSQDGTASQPSITPTSSQALRETGVTRHPVIPASVPADVPSQQGKRPLGGRPPPELTTTHTSAVDPAAEDDFEEDLRVDFEADELDWQRLDALDDEEDTRIGLARHYLPAGGQVAQPEPGQPFPATLPFLQALSTCTTLDCVRAAHQQPRKGARFNFPHFMIIGFQKACTTSLFRYLEVHPSLMRSTRKEPEYFSTDCRWRLDTCDDAKTSSYILRTMKRDEFIAGGGSQGHFEASTHYVRNADRLVAPLKRYMPWLKVIALLREPISRAASMLIHKQDASQEGCLMRQELGVCLWESSQIRGQLTGATSTNYSFPMATWFRSWPRDQMLVIQYELLTGDEAGEEQELTRVKEFLDVDVNAGRKGLGVANARRFSIQPEGHPMRREQYQRLVDLVRPDCEATVRLLVEGGYESEEGAQGWMRRWERVWQGNLDTCDGEGNCRVQLS